jgi:hypothetical protein
MLNELPLGSLVIGCSKIGKRKEYWCRCDAPFSRAKVYILRNRNFYPVVGDVIYPLPVHNLINGDEIYIISRTSKLKIFRFMVLLTYCCIQSASARSLGNN